MSFVQVLFFVWDFQEKMSTCSQCLKANLVITFTYHGTAAYLNEDWPSQPRQALNKAPAMLHRGQEFEVAVGLDECTAKRSTIPLTDTWPKLLKALKMWMFVDV